jgi:GcrA cell cycle regulator
MMPSWPPERVDALKKLWADGLSASQIAQRLGLTRGQVCGKASRLGLQGRAEAARARSIRAKHRPMAAAPAPEADGLRDRDERNHLAPLPLPLVQPEDVATVSLLDAGNSACRWPCGPQEAVSRNEPYFCGATRIPGSSYCAQHHARAVNQVPVRPLRIVEPGIIRRELVTSDR